MKETGAITGVSVAHSHASVDEIEAAGQSGVRATVSDLLAREGVEEAFAIQTCNRSEAFIVTDRSVDSTAALVGFAPDVRSGAVRQLGHEESLEHLMRVASGLESLVLGEDQIIGQVREAYEESKAAGGIGPVLKDAVTKALHVGERARNETAINEGVVSLGSAAVRLAAAELDLRDRTAVIVGAGEMGILAARSLDDTGVSEIAVANRTVPNAEFVAEEVETPAKARSLADLPALLPDADLVITATGSPDPLIEPRHVAGVGRVVCIDIAQPRDIDPAIGSRDGVTLYDIDALEDVTAQTHAQRETAAREVESIIDDELERILEAYKRKRADDAISAMYASADRVKAREVDRAISRLEAHEEVTDEQRATVEDLADALVGQLLAAPTRSLRDAAGEDDWETIRTALQLFDPEFDAPPAQPGGAGSEPRQPGNGSETAPPESVSEELDD